MNLKIQNRAEKAIIARERSWYTYRNNLYIGWTVGRFTMGYFNVTSDLNTFVNTHTINSKIRLWFQLLITETTIEEVVVSNSLKILSPIVPPIK